jgi:outer membrane protein
MRTSLVSLLLIGASVLYAQEGTKLSLEEAIRTGLERSPVMLISEQSVRQAEAEAREAATALLPSLSATGTYNRLSDVPEFAVDLPFQDIPVNGIELFPNIVDHYQARVSVRQPLFTGFRLRSNRSAARSKAEAERFGHAADRNELAYAITQAYWNVYRALEYRRVVSASIEQLKEHAQNVQNFFDEGMVTRNEVLKVEVQVSEAAVRLIEARNNVRIAMVRLNSLIGFPLDTRIVLSSLPTHTRPEQHTLDDLVEQAAGTNPELRGLDSRLQMAQASLGAARSGWYPQIYLFGNYHLQRPHQRYLPLRDEMNDSWDVGITVSFDIWNWGATGHRTAQARARMRQTEYALGRRRDDITVEVTQKYLSVESAREMIGAARLALEQAEENYRVTKDLFREDLVVNAEVLDADVALLRARMSYIDALVTFEIADAGLKKLIGSGS